MVTTTATIQATVLARAAEGLMRLANRRAEATTRARTRVQSLIRVLMTLAGFGCLTLAGFKLHTVVGLVVAGLSCWTIAWLMSGSETATEPPSTVNRPHRS